MKYDEFSSIFDKATYDSIINSIQDYDTPIWEWTEKEMDKYLHDLESVSLNTIQKYYGYVKQIYRYFNKNGKELKASKRLWEYIDMEKLRKITITHEDYKFIRNELDIYYSGQVINVRDKLMFELAWETLTSEEIKGLKENDVEEISADLIRLHLPTRIVNINDPVVIQDIKVVKHYEREYFVFRKNGSVLNYDYKESPHLIKPIAIRLDRKKFDISNLSIIFIRIMKRLSDNVTRKSRDASGQEYSLELDKIGLEGTRRSKVVYLLSFKGSTIEAVKQILGKSQQSHIVWLNKLSKKIYG